MLHLLHKFSLGSSQKGVSKHQHFHRQEFYFTKAIKCIDRLPLENKNVFQMMFKKKINITSYI